MPAPLNETMLAITFDSSRENWRYRKVPPHITVIPWFDADNNPSAMVEVESVLNTTGPIDIRRGEPMAAGAPLHEKPCITVVSEGLINVHRQLFDKLVAVGIEFSNPEFFGENYTPHYKEFTDTDPFEKVDVIQISEIAIIKNIPVISKASQGLKKINYRKLGQASG